MWTIRVKNGSAGWTSDNWPAIKRGSPWEIRATGWRAVEEDKTPYHTQLPDNWATTQPTDPTLGRVLLTDKDGVRYFGGKDTLTTLPPGTWLTTSEMSLHFLRPPSPESGAIITRARLIQAGRSQGLSEATLEDAARGIDVIFLRQALGQARRISRNMEGHPMGKGPLGARGIGVFNDQGQFAGIFRYAAPDYLGRHIVAIAGETSRNGRAIAESLGSVKLANMVLTGALPLALKPEAKSAKALVVFLLLVTAGISLVITIGGWERLEGGKVFALGYIAIYVLFAFLVMNWNRGCLPVASALADKLAAGPLIRHIVVQLRTADDRGVAAAANICHELGAAAVRPLAEALAVEDNGRAIRALREILLAFGAVGRSSVEQLKTSTNPAVRRTAADPPGNSRRRGGGPSRARAPARRWGTPYECEGHSRAERRSSSRTAEGRSPARPARPSIDSIPASATSACLWQPAFSVGAPGSGESRNQPRSRSPSTRPPRPPPRPAQRRRVASNRAR